MSKPLFKRGLNSDFVSLLKEEYNKVGSWWHNIVNDPELFVGIRAGYLNVYFHGNSLLKLTYAPKSPYGALKGETHSKYLKREGLAGKDYVYAKNGIFQTPDNSEPLEITRLADIDKIKAVACEYYKIDRNDASIPTHREKTLVQRYIEKIPNIIDLETAISGSGINQLKNRLQLSRSLPRIDLVQLCTDGDAIRIDFVEVKHIKNGEMRAKDWNHNRPPILCQLSDYQKLASDSHCSVDFIESYRQVCKNLNSFGSTKKMPLATKVTEGCSLVINPQPKLLVLYTKKSEVDSAWCEHREHLTRAFRDGSEFPNGVAFESACLNDLSE